MTTILARRPVAAAALTVAVLAGGAWLVASESAPAGPMATQAVAVVLEAPPPQPEPVAEPAIPAAAEAAPEDDPPGDDPLDLAPWAASVGVEPAEQLPAWRRFDLANKAMQTDGRFAATADRQAVRPHKSEVGL